MVAQEHVRTALKRVGMYNRFFGQAEIRELCHILMPNEKIIGAVNGRYEGGLAMLVATDRRLLLIDKKMMFLNLEDIRYDMISQVEYSARLIDATTTVHTINTVLRFTSLRQAALRRLTTFMQEKVMQLRYMIEHQQDIAQSVPASYQAAMQQADPGPAQNQLIENVGATAHKPDQTFSQRARIHPYANPPLTVRRRISRFYPVKS
jgi:hypothetical protein